MPTCQGCNFYNSQDKPGITWNSREEESGIWGVLSCKHTPSNCLFLMILPCYALEGGSSEAHFFPPRLQVHSEWCFNFFYLALLGDPAHPASAQRKAFPPPFQLSCSCIDPLGRGSASLLVFFFCP